MNNAPNKLLDTFTKISTGAAHNTSSGISYGTVTSIAPLVITRETENGRVPLTAGFLVLARTCKPLVIKTAEHTHTIPTGTASTELQELVIWEGLAVGEKVILISMNGAQKFFVERM